MCDVYLSTLLILFFCNVAFLVVILGMVFFLDTVFYMVGFCPVSEKKKKGKIVLYILEDTAR